MAVSTTGYDQSIRQLLQGKGVDNNAIGYSNGYVTVNGQNFIKPAKTYNNTAYDSAQNFNNAWNTYQQSLKQPTATASTTTATATTPNYSPTAGSAITAASNYAQNSTPTTSTTTYNPYSTSNPYDKQYSDLLSSLLQQAQNPTSVNVNEIYSSPQYAAYQAQAQKQAQQAIRSAQEAFGASGFGRSSELAQSAQGIQNDANTYLDTQVLPQLIAQAQSDQQQKLQNQLSMLGQLQQAQGTYDTRYNNAQDLALQKGQLTGNYVDPATSALINQILQDKQNYASATTPEARAQANADANAVRSQLAAMGIDPSLFGADQTLAQAQGNLSKAGTPTLAAQQQTFDQNMANRQQTLNETQVMAELTGKLPDGTPTNQYQQQQLANLWTLADQTGVIPDTLADMYGIRHGTPTQAAKQFALNYAQDQQQLGISAMNARTSASSAANSASNARFNQLMDIWQATGKAPSGLEQYGIQAGQALPTSSSAKTTPVVNAKDSANNLSEAKGNLDGLSKSEAIQYAQGIANYLTDSDYRSLLNYIDDNY